jgi:Hemolysins and related proteins containing CBS domains
MDVHDVMTPRSELVTVALPGTRDDVLRYLQEEGFSSVPVVKPTDDGEAYRGIVSRQELIDRPEENQLAVLMRDVPSVSAGASVTALAELMREQDERRIPVVDGTLAGIVTVTDVVRAIAREEVTADAEVGAVAGREVNAVYEQTPLPVVEREIFLAAVPYAVCLDAGGALAGIVTEVDIIDVAEVVEGEDETGGSVAEQDDSWMWEGIKVVGTRFVPTRNVEIPDAPVAEFMTADVATTTPTASAVSVAQAMISHDIEQLPVLDGDRITGVVRDIDLLGAI